MFATADLHARAVAVVPGLRRVDRDFILPIEFSDSLQSFPKDRALHFQLDGISRVLVMAAATLPEVRAGSLNPRLRRPQKLIERGPRIPRLFLQDGCADFFTRKDKGHKDRFALGAAGQAVSA